MDKKAEAGIFVGYSAVTKAYRIYVPQRDKIIISRDVQFFEYDSWNWKDEKKIEEQSREDDVDDEPVRRTRTIADIYQRCNVAAIEPANFKEATAD